MMEVNHTELENLMKGFRPISLKEMDSVELMNRTDTKFIFSSCYLPEILKEIQQLYYALEIDDQRIFSYRTTYYDTPDYLLFTDHMHGKLNRHKVRHRLYESTGTTFLEIKQKTNKNRTIKWRIKNEQNGHLDDDALNFLSGHLKNNPNNLNPVITNRFSRITLVHLEAKTRITLDFNITFLDKQQNLISLPYLAIAEVKREKTCSQDFFIQLLRNKRIYQAGFSKYCMGSAMLYELPKKNYLKPSFLLLKRIENEYNTHASIR